LISIFPNQASQETEVKPIVMRDAIIIPSLDSLHIEDKGMNGLAKVGLLSQNRYHKKNEVKPKRKTM
jgi:hypothetical protein